MSKRSERWKIKTRPDLLGPKLEAVHVLSSEQIKRAYDTIDELYSWVSKMLDEEGITITQRAIYRAYAEELWKASESTTRAALTSKLFAIYAKYLLFGCENDKLKAIAKKFGVELTKSELSSRLGLALIGIYIGTEPPPSPEEGWLWYNPEENRLYEYVVP
jgi:hypothetical protein